MATNRREVSIDAPAAKVWDAVRDFAHVHERVAPGFLIRLESDKGDRVLTGIVEAGDFGARKVLDNRERLR